jgi:hypothetical protein
MPLHNSSYDVSSLESIVIKGNNLKPFRMNSYEKPRGGGGPIAHETRIAKPHIAWNKLNPENYIFSP